MGQRATSGYSASLKGQKSIVWGTGRIVSSSCDWKAYRPNLGFHTRTCEKIEASRFSNLSILKHWALCQAASEGAFLIASSIIEGTSSIVCHRNPALPPTISFDPPES